MLANGVRLALAAVRRNALRSTLTVLGIVIGVAAVITMVTLGNGATRAVAAQIQSLGSNLLMVRPGQRLGPGREGVRAPNFRLGDAQAIAAEVPDVAAVAPTTMRGATVVAGTRNWSTTVVGGTEPYFAVRAWTLAAGRAFTDAEERAGRAVCVVGETVRRELFGTEDPVGGSIRVGPFACEVVGLLAPKGQSTMGMDQDDTVVLPLRTLQRRLTGNQDVTTILVAVRDGASTADAMEQVRALMRERRDIAPNEDDNFNVLDTRQIAETLSGTTRLMTALLGAVAAVSLLVGGIGIMNVMLVSVTERTREIGIRLAVGALARDVLLQFLVEAAVLACLGGVAGVALAALASVALARALAVPFAFDPWINLLSFGFAAAVGVVFGYFPARRAARLDPIEALRHE